MTDANPRFDTGNERFCVRYLFATLLANVDELQRVTGIEPEDDVDDRVGPREDLQRHVAETTAGVRQLAAPATRVTSLPSRSSAQIVDFVVRTTGERQASPNMTAC